MSAHPCCIRVIPYENKGDRSKLITMSLYVSANGKGIPEEVSDDAKEMFENYAIEFVDLQKRPPSKLFIPLPSSEKRQDQRLSDLSGIIKENLHLFENRLNVTAVQASYKVKDSKEQDIPCIAVFVLGKTKVPAGETDMKTIKDDPLFQDIEFDVLEGYYQPAIDALQASHTRSLRSGFGIGVKGSDSAGTLGGFLEDETGKHYILSNWHVLRPHDKKNENVVVQPATCDYKVMCDEAEANLKREERTKTPATEKDKQKKVFENLDLEKETEESIKEATEERDKIKGRKPRQIGTFVDGLRDNVRVDDKFGGGKIYVDAAIAELDEKEEARMMRAKKKYPDLFGFEEQGTSDKIVDLEGFINKLRTGDTDELRFKKYGRTTGFTDGGCIDDVVTDLYVTIFDDQNAAPRDDPIASVLSDVPYPFCRNCKFSDTNERILNYDKKKCTSCDKTLEESDQFGQFWARNCFVIRKRKNAFCDQGDSGALVFDEDGKAWGLLHGVFDDDTRNFFFGLASPLSFTLKALEQKSGKKGLKLWSTKGA